MTENEAISRIKDHMEIHRLKEPRAIYITVALSMAISALKEIQQYREIGTVEECRTAVEELPKAEEVIKKLLCGDYSSPCMFCVYGEDNDAECCNIGGGKSWCYKNAQWNGKESEEE